MSIFIQSGFQTEQYYANTFEKCKDTFDNCQSIIASHRSAVEDIIAPNGLDALPRIMSVIDSKGWVAIRGFYQNEWLNYLSDEVNNTPSSVIGESSYVNDGNPLLPLTNLFLDLSSTGCKNSDLKYNYSTVHVVKNKDLQGLHSDKVSGHIFLSSPIIENNDGGEGHVTYVFKEGKSLSNIKVCPNQLVIVGGSAEQISPNDPDYIGFQSVLHGALHESEIERTLYNTFKCSY